MNRTEMLRSILVVELDGLKTDIERDLRSLAQRVTDAQKAFAAGGSISPTLVAQYAMLTETIGRYNQIRNILPLVEDEP